MVDLVLPRELSSELIEILGMPNFRSVPIARAFRAAGRAQIRERFEDEQAFALHWQLSLFLEHGAGWRARAGEVLTQVIEEAKAKVAGGQSVTGSADA